jgi:hypothetical protein
MLPVSAWPPGPPGAALSPFGQPRDICVPSGGCVLPKGAWIVRTGGNRVVMYFPPVVHVNPARSPGTGLLPGQKTPPPNPCKPTFHKYNDVVTWFRSQGRIGPSPGRRPPNWYGWKCVPAPCATLVPPGAAGLVIADGQNVVLQGGGWANITQAYSV